MKQFSSTVARIKNTSGEYEPIPALRGATPYEIAVRNGFQGSEEEWYNLSFDEGWVTKYQELEAEKANASDVYTKSQMDNILACIDAAEIGVSPTVANGTNHSTNIDSALIYLTEAAVLSSYMILVSNTNEEAVSAALGKNNMGLIHGVGRSLAMYARYKDPENVSSFLDDEFPNLIMCDRLSTLTPAACDEIMENQTLHDLFEANPFMHERMVYYLTKQANRLFYKGVTTSVASGLAFSTVSNAKLIPSIANDVLRYTGNGTSGNNSYEHFLGSADIPTNGAKYLCFRLKSLTNHHDTHSKFGIVQDGGAFVQDKVITGIDSAISYSIDISGLESIQLGFDTAIMNAGTAAEFEYIVLSDFAII